MKGIYKPRNPAKYKGDVGNIIYRSQPELKYMFWLDKNPNVLFWSSEEVIIPYYDDANRRFRRYFPDFWVKMQDGREFIIEYKPHRQTQPPRQTKKPTRTQKTKYLKEAATYITNRCKWEAAEKYATSRNIKFLILTEKDLLKL